MVVIENGSGASYSKLRCENRLVTVGNVDIVDCDQAKRLLVGPTGSAVKVTVEYWNGNKLLSPDPYTITRKV